MEEIRALTSTSTQAQREAQFESERAELQAEVERVRAECDGLLAAAKQDKQLQLDRMLIDLSGDAEAKAALLGERAREERVALLTRQIGRRMLNRDVSLAFAAWIEQWEAKTYALMRLRQVAGRLRVPELASAYAFWVEYTLARQAAAEKAALLAVSRSLEGQLRAAHNETNQLAMVKLKHEDEIRALLEKLHGLTQVSE